MSQDSNVVNMGSSRKKKFKITDRERIVLAYHAYEQQNPEEATKLLASIDQGYYLMQFHKDIARALLCWATRKETQNEALAKESEFYLVVYRLTKHVVANRANFPKSGHFLELKDTLFKDFQL